jgi:hypothetical protein
MRRSDHANELPDPSDALAVEVQLGRPYVAQSNGRQMLCPFISEVSLTWQLSTGYCFFSCPAFNKFT